MQEVKGLKEQDEELNKEQKKRIQRIFYIHLSLALVFIIGALTLTGFTGFYFYKAQKIMNILEGKGVIYNSEPFLFEMEGEMRMLQNEYNGMLKIVMILLCSILIYCIVAMVVLFLFHFYINKKYPSYNEKKFFSLKKEKE